MKKTKKVLAMIMMGTMMTTMGTSVFAATYPNTDLTTAASNIGTEAEPATVELTKNLFMDSNITTPNKTFNFTFEKVSVDLVTGDNAKVEGKMPTIGTKSIEIGEATDNNDTTKFIKADGTDASDTADASHATKVVSDKTSNVLDGVTWPHAGEYVYKVVETNPSDASIKNSQAVYTMTVYVANGAVDGDLYVAGVGVVETVSDAGTDIDDQKIDATDGSSTIGTGSMFAFRNDYNVLSDLKLSKAVDGTYADQTKEFSYSLKLTNPAVGSTSNKYTAIVYNGDTASTDTIEFTVDTAKTFTLHHGQSIRFVDEDENGILPVGVTYTVTETGTPDYTSQVNVKYNGDTDGLDIKNTNAGVDVTADATSIKEIDGTNVRVTTVGENQNAADFLNTYKSVTPTGVLLENAPFILMIGVAIGGAAIYLVSKKKKLVNN